MSTSGNPRTGEPPRIGSPPEGERIQRQQWTTFAGATLGWGLEGFDIALFALILGPAVTELLGSGASSGDIVFHIGLSVTIFLLGWTLGAVFFGVIADYFGRVWVLSLGVLMYAVFTGAAALAHEYWLFALMRFVAGLGSGVEGPVGAVLVAESWRNKYRARATGIMLSGYAVGYFIASLVYSAMNAAGWRWTLTTALAPALLVLFIRRFVPEPEISKQVQTSRRQGAKSGAPGIDRRFVLARLISPPLRRKTLCCILIQSGALFAFWSMTTWMPQLIRNVSTSEGNTGGVVASHVAMATALLYLGCIAGYAGFGFIADAIGRKWAFHVGLIVSAISIGFLFPFSHSFSTFLWALPLVGFGVCTTVGGGFVYFPEVFPASVRTSGLAMANSVGRLFTVPGPLVAGAIATKWFDGNLGSAIAATSCLLVLSLIGVLLADETRGLGLAEDSVEHNVPVGGAPAPSL
jgi:MFS family permease